MNLKWVNKVENVVEEPFPYNQKRKSIKDHNNNFDNSIRSMCVINGSFYSVRKNTVKFE